MDHGKVPLAPDRAKANCLLLLRGLSRPGNLLVLAAGFLGGGFSAGGRDLGRPLDEKIFELGTGFEPFPQPDRLRAAAGPGRPRLAIAVFRRNFSAFHFALAVNGNTPNRRIVRSQRGKLFLQGVGTPAEHGTDVITQLEQRVDRHGSEVGRSGHRGLLTKLTVGVWALCRQKASTQKLACISTAYLVRYRF